MYIKSCTLIVFDGSNVCIFKCSVLLLIRRQSQTGFFLLQKEGSIYNLLKFCTAGQVALQIYTDFCLLKPYFYNF